VTACFENTLFTHKKCVERATQASISLYRIIQVHLLTAIEQKLYSFVHS